MACPDDETVAELVADQLDTAARATVLAHLDSCEACRGLVGDVLASDGDDDNAARPRVAGDRIGRYLIDGVLGVGGMGVVYAAHDTQLARSVALKLLRGGVLGDASLQEERALLLDEAQTLAKLSHPNLVTIYDVGVDGDRWFIAMELVDGQTLRAWLLSAQRTWAEIRSVFTQAGRGLEAAHAAGVIHRDFKPDNVLVGRDGRVRVTDFGLARLLAAPASYQSRLAGTPAYMPPEQRAGGVVDGRADVYSFCVALYEALHGERPVAGTKAGVGSRRVRRALDAGLAADPQDRPATMTALLAELAPGPRRLGLVALAAVLLFTATAFSLGRLVHDPCADAEQAWGAIWDGGQRAAAQARLAATEFTTTDAALADYHARWVATRRAVCQVGARKQVPVEVVDQRMTCLDDLRRDADAAALMLATSDVGDRAVELVSSLSPAEGCAGRGDVAPLPNTVAGRAALANLSTRLAEVKALYAVSKFAPCLAAVNPAVEDARRLGNQALLARLLYYRAECEPDDKAVHDDLTAAGAAAVAGHDDRTLARVWNRLMFVAGYRHLKWDEAAGWEAYARAALDRLGGDREIEMEFLSNLFLVLERRGHTDDALAMLDGMRRVALELDGPESARMAHLEELWGNALNDVWRFSEALEHHRRAIQLEEAIYGAASRTTCYTLENYAEDLSGLGRGAEALAIHDRIRDLPSRPLDDSWFRQSRATALRQVGRLDDALVEAQAAVATCERYADVEPSRCSVIWETEGRALLALHRDDEAAALLERSYALPAEAQTPDLGFALAQAIVARDPARARTLALAARARVAALVADHPADRRPLDEIDAWLAGK